MKSSFVGIIVMGIVIAGCQPPQQQAEPAEPRSNGYVNTDNPDMQDLQWKMGSQEAVDFIDQLIADYNARNVDAAMAAFADTAVFHFSSGVTVANKDSLRKGLTDFYNNTESHEWNTVFSFSVDLDLEEGGEWVFTGGNEYYTMSDGTRDSVGFVEAFYVVDGKVVEAYQMERKLAPEE